MAELTAMVPLFEVRSTVPPAPPVLVESTFRPVVAAMGALTVMSPWAVAVKFPASLGSGVVPGALPVVGALGRSTKGVNFDALDNQPVSLVMLFLVPQGQFQKHLHTLAEIAKLLHKKDFRKSLEESSNAAAMYHTIKSQTAAK